MAAFHLIHEPGHRVKQRRAPRKGDEEWASHRPIIENLYSFQNRSLKDVMKIMEQEHDFSASRRQYEYHLARWKVSKYTPRTSLPYLSPVSAAMELGDVDMTASFHVGQSFESDTLQHDAGALPYEAMTQVEPELLSSLFSPLPWEGASVSAQQHIVALDDKELDVAASHERHHPHADPLAQFSDCTFVELDHFEMHSHHSDNHPNGKPALNSEHHWRLPDHVIRLLDLDRPASQRTHEQRYRLQKMIWCLWLCGNNTCFTNLARNAKFRTIRVADDIARFETHVEAWIETSVGYPEGMQPTPTFRRTVASAPSIVSPSKFVSDPSLRLRETGIGNWTTHALAGYQLAMLRCTGKTTEARDLSLRLKSDLKAAPGWWSFFASFAMLNHLIQKCLMREIANLRALDLDVRTFVSSLFEDGADNTPEAANVATECKAIGVLSLLCYQRWTQSPGHSSEREACIEASTGFPIAKAFQWAFRLLLFCSKQSKVKEHKKPGLQIATLTPLGLCSQALNGLSVMNLCSGKSAEGCSAEEWQVERTSQIWLEWLARDASWFLPSVLSADVTESPINIWQNINR